MYSDSLSYNPNNLCEDSITWFKEFFLLQDEVPSNLLSKKEDILFLNNKLIQVKAYKPESFKKSIFASHQLQPEVFLPKKKNVINPEWVSPLLILIFLLFAIAKYGYFRNIQQIFKAFFNNRLFNQLFRDGGLFSERVSLILFSSYLLSLSLFIFKISCFYFNVPDSFLLSLFLFVKILISILIFYILKMGVFNLSGFIFRSSKETSGYVLNIYVFGQITGVLMLPIIVLITYLCNEIIIYTGLILFSLIYLYRLFRGFSIAISNVKGSIYYLFLYLCTLEILPFFLLAKVVIKMIH